MAKFHEYIIPTNFRIPKEFSHRFMLNIGRESIEISRHRQKRIKVKLFGQPTGHLDANRSLALDWIQETIERIRMECGA